MKEKDWFLPKEDTRRHKWANYYRANERQLRNSAFTLRLCTICDKVYECFYADNKRQVVYYDDFVTLGLERKTCDKCNKSS